MKIDSIIDHDSWIAKNYGSRSGFVKTLYYQLLNLTGIYTRYKKIDWRRVDRLVFVCKGNICRSAFAEAVAISSEVVAISFGLDTKGNEPAHSAAIKIADLCGYDLSQHKTTTCMVVDIREGDLLVAMEPWQVCRLRKRFNNKYQYTLLGLWVNPPRPYIHDPYGMKPVYFERCFTVIKNAVFALVRSMG